MINGEIQENNDEQALAIHFKKFHGNEIKKNNFKLSKAYKVTFLEKPQKWFLDIAENFWISRINATINIARTCLPMYK